MKDHINNNQTPPDQEGFDFKALEQRLEADFTRALRDDQMDSLLAQIDQSVSSLKAAVESPEDRVIRLCGELIDACRNGPNL